MESVAVGSEALIEVIPPRLFGRTLPHLGDGPLRVMPRIDGERPKACRQVNR